MTSIEFDQLELNTRANYLWDTGRYIAERISYNHRISLWSIDDFYIEVHYAPEENIVSSIESVQNIRLLALYVPDTELENLF